MPQLPTSPQNMTATPLADTPPARDPKLGRTQSASLIRCAFDTSPIARSVAANDATAKGAISTGSNDQPTCSSRGKRTTLNPPSGTILARSNIPRTALTAYPTIIPISTQNILPYPFDQMFSTLM